ncbi:MAG: DegV family protein [Longicatena sp.]
MVKIITDTSALFTIEEGKKMGVCVLPLNVTINNKQYKDLCSDTAEFIEEIHKGGIPSSSQPPIGDVAAAYEAVKGEEILNICMADGLSGTYQTACMAKEQADNKADIYVLNSRTLCGPHRYLVEKAVKLRDEGKRLQEIVDSLLQSMAHEHSFLIPQDFSFLKRGGRLKPAAASIGGLLKLKPIMEAVQEGSRLDKQSIVRTLSKAAQNIGEYFEQHGVNENYKVYISHADALEDALHMKERIEQYCHGASIEILKLSHAFITQGGPHCIAIQYILK